MANEYVQDPFYGNLATNFMNAMRDGPHKALANTALAEQIVAAREERARKTEAWAKGQELVGTVDASTPQAYVAPRPYTAADISNPAILNAPLSVTDRVSGSLGGGDVPNGMFTDPRALAMAEARRKTAVAGQQATLLKDPSQWAAQSAYAENATTGMPTDAAERARLQFGATGRYPTREEMKTPNAQNFTIVNADGTGTGQIYSSLDGGRTAIGGASITLAPGQRPVETGAGPQQPVNPMESAAKAREQLAVLSKTIGSGDPTVEQQAIVKQLVAQAYPPKRVVEKVGDRMEEKYVQEEPIPDWAVRMMAPLPTAAPPPGVTAPPPAAVAPAPVTGGGGGAATPAAPVPAAAAAAAATPAPAPFNPNASRTVATMPGSAIELRKEVMTNPAIKTYGEAVPMYNTMINAAKGDVANGLLPTSSSDLNIIYAVAKLFDPGSVVREGELKLAAGTAPISDALQAAWSKAITGDGMMTPEMRANLIHQGLIRMEQYRVAKNLVHNQYTDIATKTGIDPSMAIPTMPDMLPFDRNAILNPTITPPARRSADDILNGR